MRSSRWAHTLYADRVFMQIRGHFGGVCMPEPQPDHTSQSDPYRFLPSCSKCLGMKLWNYIVSIYQLPGGYLVILGYSNATGSNSVVCLNHSVFGTFGKAVVLRRCDQCGCWPPAPEKEIIHSTQQKSQSLSKSSHLQLKLSINEIYRY